MSARSDLLLVACTLLAATGCDASERGHVPSTPLRDAAAGVDAHLSVDATVPSRVDAAFILDASTPAPRSIPLGVELGSFFDQVDGGADLGDAAMLAAGVSAVVLHVPFVDYELESRGSAGRWSRLATRAALYARAGAYVVVAVDLVQRTVALRPPGDLSWYSPQKRTQIEELVDKLYELMAPDVRAISFGNEVDRYLGVTSDPARSQFQQLLLYALRYARAHRGAQPQGDRTVPVLVGVGATLDGWLKSLTSQPEDAVMAPFLPEVGALMVSYLPLQETDEAVPDDKALEPLQQLRAAAGNRPVLLQEISYPSSQEAGSSPVRQASFYRRLFDMLSADSQAFTLLSISPHTDASAEACAADTATYSHATPTLLAARCSLGLWQQNGQPKPAWSVVLSGLSSFYPH